MNSSTSSHNFFREKLLFWHHHINTRTLPWKEVKDPYKIWLSEIILQQTRVEQGLPYYHAFIKKYSTIKKLAAAPQEEVFRLWQGLGYYSRCKNLHKTANIISVEYDGKFPNEYDKIIALPGIGDYTAAAIASFAFNLPYAVVDGNVFRVLSRFFGIDTPIDTAEGKKTFYALASEILDKGNPAAYNQAIMDYGAIVCKPQSPLCDQCNLSTRCFAYKKEMTAMLPVKQKKLKIRERHFHYILLIHKDQLFIRERIEKDIWQHLFEFYLIENNNDNLNVKDWQQLQPYLKQDPYLVFNNTQKLSHQKIMSTFYIAELRKQPSIKKLSGLWVQPNELKNYAFPKTIVSFFNQNNYF